ncbi:MAG: 2-methylcitrate dehydratase [Rhodospirillaceae bacterium]|nr:2-methylcitrate dehydratase [Rhodospirillaceae bacterium]
MQTHTVRVWPSAEAHPREDELAWKIAAVAADPVAVDDDVAAMVVNRIIDNASVALASINRSPIVSARAQALAHPRSGGATLFGMGPDVQIHAEWAAWTNGTAVRELDFHDTFLHQEFGHPGDNICPLIAVAQQKKCSGADLIRGIATAYEVHVNLMKSIRLHSHKIDHVAHTGVGAAAGIGAMLGLAPEVIYQAINHTLHVCCATRQSRKGQISSWKSAAPAHSSKLAIEEVDRAMRGETAPAPIYEGEDSVIAWLLDGPDAEYQVPLPEAGEAKRSILETWTKAHSAEYQGQAFIDLALRLRGEIGDMNGVSSIVIRTNNHAHDVIGSGANDPQKYSPDASRETLDHSLPYIFAVALEDGSWHHEASYTKERAHRAETVALWQKITTEADQEWERRYMSDDPAKRAYGGAVEVTLADGKVLKDEIAFADAHPLGAKPFEFEDYVAKFRSLAEGIASSGEQDRFIDLVVGLKGLDGAALSGLNPAADATTVKATEANEDGIF